MDQKPVIFLITDAVVILSFVILKSLSFSRSSRKANFKRWLYFSNYEIINASNEKVKKARKRQNRLSLAIFILLLLSPVLFFLVSSLS